MKAIEQYFHVVLLIMLYKVVPTFKAVDDILVCDHSNENYWVVLTFKSMNKLYCDHLNKSYN